jgi:DNA-binding CsgD family transcriptional regulator
MTSSGSTAVRSGNAATAADAMERLAETAEAGGASYGLGVAARSRALLSDGTAADGLYQEAIERLSRARLRPELARAHLLYGEWLRRELLAAGVTLPRHPQETRAPLTAQEATIARLARDGQTNAEIGAQLFLSARTVEWHLGNVFTKLGIVSRRELRRALAHPPGADSPA